MPNENLDQVVPLKQLDDFKVAEGEPDVRGWDVVSADGRKIGEVEELLVDTGAMKVRYLDVDLDNSLIAGDPDRHVLVPIGYARLERERDCVVVDNLNASDLASLPAYDHRPLTRDFETSVRDSFGRGTTAAGAAGAAGGAADDFYGHQSFDDSGFYGARRGAEGEQRLTLSEEELELQKRRVQAGEVGVHKRVETEHVRESVPTMREEVTVERRPVTDPLRADTQITEDEIRIPLREEEVVVEKRVVPKEELVVRKQQVVEHQTVEADLARERADVVREGGATVRDDLHAADLDQGAGGLGNSDPTLRRDPGEPGGLGNQDPNPRNL
ncbi:MAG TPA: DUF2382 domain-containing protein [Longimicrobium sp.]|jgi:uncharacterized protein (TIGR02271 family)